jgi:N-acetylneuraminate synthase
MKKVIIGNKEVGEDNPVFIVAELGINHNGDVEIAKQLIDVAVEAGCDAVKFQKRTIELVYSKEELQKPRESPWGTTFEEQKRGLEFGQEEYQIIDEYCKDNDILWLASCWDTDSVDFIDAFDPPCFKIASASLTDDDLLQYTRSKGKTILLSTGMSTLEQIHHAVDVLGEEDLVLLHCTSTYPSKLEELNLNVITTLKREFSCPIGYSGHEIGVSSSIVAAVLGACIVERHLTLDRAMYGSDQAASLEPQGMKRLVRDIKELPTILGDGKKRVYESELPIIQKLRRVQ